MSWKVTNKKTGEDVTDLYYKLMKREITNKEFEEATGLKPSKENPSREDWEERQKNEK